MIILATSIKLSPAGLASNEGGGTKALVYFLKMFAPHSMGKYIPNRYLHNIAILTIYEYRHVRCRFARWRNEKPFDRSTRMKIFIFSFAFSSIKFRLSDDDENSERDYN